MSNVIAGQENIERHFAQVRKQREADFEYMAKLVKENYDALNIGIECYQSDFSFNASNDDGSIQLEFDVLIGLGANNEFVLRIKKKDQFIGIRYQFNTNCDKRWDDSTVEGMTDVEKALTTLILDAAEGKHGSLYIFDMAIKMAADRKRMTSVFTVLN